ncbi:hypothetical protein [Paenibacillus taichungensis]|nr:hypothetical protein [Paenibacillus taichungensis]
MDSQGGTPSTSEDGNQITVIVHEQAVLELVANLRSVEQTYEIASLPGILFRVARTEITDQDGHVIETIG